MAFALTSLTIMGYLFMPWFVIPYKKTCVWYTILEAFYNKHVSRGRVVVVNAFGMLKKHSKNCF
jgi:hypothetical protein